MPVTISGLLIRINNVYEKPSERRPIVFIHGWLNQDLLFYFFKKFFEKKGFAVYMTNHGFLTGDITENAKQLSNFFESNKLKNAILIGASLGSVISYYYLQRMNGWDKVDRFISVGGPFQGFPLANVAFFLKSGKQAKIGGRFLVSLIRERIKNPSKILIIRAKYDEVVPFYSSSMKEVNVITLNVLGHINLIAFSVKTFDAIVKFVRD